MQIHTYKIKVYSPQAFFWITKKATNESMAKSMALGQHAGRFGWYIAECVKVEEKRYA